MSLQDDQNMPADRPRNGRSPARSRVSNGSSLLGSEVDGRCIWARRLRELIDDHVADLGGEANTSVSERSIIRRASCLTVELERLEVKFALAGQASDTDLDLYQRCSGNLRRLLEAVGLQRRARDVTDDVLARALREELSP
jgi:hypothetical protein